MITKNWENTMVKKAVFGKYRSLDIQMNFEFENNC